MYVCMYNGLQVLCAFFLQAQAAGSLLHTQCYAISRIECDVVYSWTGLDWWSSAHDYAAVACSCKICIGPDD
jgi:hypothetical protein